MLAVANQLAGEANGLAEPPTRAGVKSIEGSMFGGTAVVLATVFATHSAAADVVRRDVLFADLWLTQTGADRVAVAYAAPLRDARVRGTLIALSRPCGHSSCLGIDFRGVSGERIAWLFEIGGRERAATVFIVARRGPWIQLPADPFPSPVWIELGAGALDGEVAPVTGRVFGFAGGIRATDLATGESIALADGDRFVVERISGGVVVLRPESAPAERYQVSLSRLFDRRGRPLLWPVSGVR